MVRHIVIEEKVQNMFKLFLALCLVVGLGWQSANAEESIPSELKVALSKLIPGAEPDRVEQSAIPGVYEVVFGPTIVYFSADGRYMLQGNILDTKTQVNLTENKRRRARMDAVNGLGEDDMIVFAPKDTKHTVTVFTDVECGYCAKLHSEMGKLNGLGIKVRYLAFPRAGIPSAVYNKMVSVWCADDAKKAMTDAKARRDVAAKQCDNPVKEHFEMGRLLGVSGTPTIVFENGDMVPGYVPAKRLAAALEESKLQ